MAQSDEKSVLSGAKIPKITQYHSFEFHDTHMIMWRYFGIGKGITWKYNPVTFVNNMKLVKPFSITNSTNKYVPAGNLKKRETREICNLHFCLENGCSAAFDNQLQLEQHVLSNQHSFSTVKSGMDKVKMSFVNHMKKSSNVVTPFTVETRPVQQKVNEGSCLIQFSETGWALPVRQKFRFSSKQKKILYKYFIDGETSGKKFSAQQVHLLIRRELEVDEYVTYANR